MLIRGFKALEQNIIQGKLLNFWLWMGGVTNYKARQNQEKLSMYTEVEKKNRYNLRAVFKTFF